LAVAIAHTLADSPASGLGAAAISEVTSALDLMPIRLVASREFQTRIARLQASVAVLTGNDSDSKRVFVDTKRA
jgi:hypothetical protein